MFVNSVGEGRKGGKRGKDRGRERARVKKDFYQSYFALEPSRSGVLLCICEKRTHDKPLHCIPWRPFVQYLGVCI